MIHTKDKTGKEVRAFLDGWQALCAELDLHKPLVCIPTAYNFMTEAELFSQGVRLVIHANHPLRAAALAMQKVCDSILSHGRSLEADDLCLDLAILFDLVGVDERITEDRGLDPSAE